MKRFALPLFACFSLCLSACGTSSVSQTSGAPSAPAPHQLYTFEVDARPVDGLYQKLSLRLDEETGTYAASMDVITPGDLLPVQEYTDEIGTSLECTAEKNPKGKLQKLFCMHDNRPADGFLIELTITRNADKLYDVILHKNAYPQVQGHPGFDETTEIAWGMKRKS